MSAETPSTLAGSIAPTAVVAPGLAGATAPVGDSGISPGLRSELQKAGIVATTLDAIYNTGRKHSVWPLQFGLACCAIEMISSAASRFDLARFGAEVFRPSPRQADLLIVAGTVTKKMAPQVVRLYNQMPEPKYVIAMGVCAISGGPFKEGYNVLKGIDRYIPVDVHIPGCPPRPEALIHALMTLQRKIEAQATLAPTSPGVSGTAANANPAYSRARREFPIPVYSGRDLVPPYNPEVWRPPARQNYTG
ncbi:NADH-quinone oxidoreductase subunit B [Verrucomicrobia bacterium LW23]|nr:NADH-quinone oxidoreductase subunit B [Verrucomicrobia bacterium LW23]